MTTDPISDPLPSPDIQTANAAEHASACSQSMKQAFLSCCQISTYYRPHKDLVTVFELVWNWSQIRAIGILYGRGTPLGKDFTQYQRRRKRAIYDRQCRHFDVRPTIEESQDQCSEGDWFLHTPANCCNISGQIRRSICCTEASWPRQLGYGHTIRTGCFRTD